MEDFLYKDLLNIIYQRKSELEHVDNYYEVLKQINFLKYTYAIARLEDHIKWTIQEKIRDRENYGDFYSEDFYISNRIKTLIKIRHPIWYNLKNEIERQRCMCKFKKKILSENKKSRYRNSLGGPYVITYQIKFNCIKCGLLYYGEEKIIEPITTSRITLSNNNGFINPFRKL